MHVCQNMWMLCNQTLYLEVFEQVQQHVDDHCRHHLPNQIPMGFRTGRQFPRRLPSCALSELVIKLTTVYHLCGVVHLTNVTTKVMKD